MRLVARFFGAALVVLGGATVLHDLSALARGSDEPVLALLLALGRLTGCSEWVTALVWIAPVVMGALLLIVPATPRRRHTNRPRACR